MLVVKGVILEELHNPRMMIYFSIPYSKLTQSTLYGKLTNAIEISKIFDDGGVLEINNAGELAAFAKATYNEIFNEYLENVFTAYQAGDNTKIPQKGAFINVKLMSDIDLGDFNWVPIGDSNSDVGLTFTNFDGNNKTISNLKIDGDNTAAGLFSFIFLSKIKNLTVNGSIEGTSQAVGGIAGAIFNSDIENCISDVEINCISGYTGGIAGLSMSYLTTSDPDLLYSKITNSANKGNIQDFNPAAGGICTSQGGYLKISNCYNTGTLLDSSYPIANNYTGNNNYYLDTCVPTTPADSEGTAKTDAYMKSQAFVDDLNTWVNTQNASTQDSYSLWKVKSNAYPIFEWQKEITNAETPTITVQPQNQTVSINGAVNLSVTANVSVTSAAAITLSYQWYSNENNSNSGGSAISGATTSTYSTPTSTVGTTYYYCVVTNTDSSATGIKTATATSSPVKVVVNELTNAEIPTITAQPQNKTVKKNGTAELSVTANVSVTSAAAITLSYQWYRNTNNINSGGNAISGATASNYSTPTSTVGTTYYYCVVTNTDISATGSQTATAISSPAKVIVNELTNDSSGGNSNNSTVTEQTTPAQTGVDILVNGKTVTAATAITKKEGDKTVTTVTVDDKKVEEKLKAEGKNAVVTISVKNADVVVGQLNGQTVKNMEKQEAVLEIKTENIIYTLPASQINIDSVSEQIGEQVALKDILVNVSISNSTEDTVTLVQDTADKNNYQILVKPVDFKITCSSGTKTVDISKFNGYVERTIVIPDGIDPSKITTGIVLNSDGTFSHVPTVITVIDGKYYAKINSLTNSTYSVIWNKAEFSDVATHWSKEAVNDMGSRLVVSGVGDGTFLPNRDITRAEFATIVVKALGLMRTGTGEAAFDDVAKAAWYYDAVSIASEYGIISGYGNGRFGPADKITREQAMTMIAKAMKITDLTADFSNGEAEKLLVAFGDSDKSAAWAMESMAACVKTGIVSGRNSKTIAPKDYITRAETAVMVRNLLKKSNLI